MFYKDELFEVLVQDNIKTISTKIYQRFVDSEQLRFLKQKQLEALSHTGFNKMLIDFQTISVVAPEDQDWLARTWFPQAEKLGLAYFAFVNSAEVFGNYALKRVQREAEVQQLTIREFASPESAQRWLQDLLPNDYSVSA